MHSLEDDCIERSDLLERCRLETERSKLLIGEKRVVRPRLRRASKHLHCLVHFAAPTENHAQIVQGIGVLGIDLEGFAESRLSL